MLIAGLDLAAEPKGTALAVIDWSPGRAELVSLQLGIDDYAIIEAVADCEKFGIDCALGWPIAFVEFLNRHNNINESGSGFDAVIAALATRSAFLGHYEGPNLEQLQHARIEGWVALPNTALAKLIEQPNS